LPPNDFKHVPRLINEVLGRHGDLFDPATAELAEWFDVQINATS
jgi:hypothetical protein